MIHHNKEQRVAWFNSLHSRVSGAGIMCEASDGKLLIVKANYKNHWTTPGGLIDPGESPLEAAARETSEEVGIDLPIDRIKFVYVASRHSEFALTYQFIFHAFITDQEVANLKLQENEIDEYDFVSKEEVLSGNRNYGKAIINWAEGLTGYIEQDLSEHG